MSDRKSGSGYPTSVPSLFRRRREPGAHRALLAVGAKIRHPIDQLVAGVAKFFWGHSWVTKALACFHLTSSLSCPKKATR